MPKTKISEFSATPGNNTDIDGINIAEGCAPSGINDAIRELMAQLKDFQAGTAGDSFNGPVGTSTAAAGAFTTLSASSSVTLSGGTANGVPYLNGSKVLTTGSALTFNGTSLGIGAAPTGFGKLDVSQSTNFRILFSGSAAYGNNAIAGINDAGSETHLGLAGTPIAFYVQASEQARLTSTGLGIGTSSPFAKLQVVAASADYFNPQVMIGEASNSTGKQLHIGYNTTANTGYIQAVHNGTGYKDLILQPNGGNLGLGVTPSAWWANTKALQVGAGMAIEARTSDATVFSIGANQYIGASTNRIYLTSNVASLYEQNTGQHQWFIAPSGTAGNAISFTQAMTLNASADLLVGTTTTTGGRATISAVANYNDLTTGYSLVLANSPGTGTNSNPVNVGVIQFGNPSATNGDIGRISLVQENPSGSTAGSMRFFTNGGGGNTQTLERARITSGGEVYIAGTTDQGAYNLQVNGTGVWGAGAYVNGSDERLKDNIQTLNDGLAVVSQLRPVTFQYKTEYSKDQSVQPGFIAQELQQAMAGKDYVDGVVQSGPEYLNVAYQNLIPILTKAIQELKAEFDAYKATHP